MSETMDKPEGVNGTKPRRLVAVPAGLVPEDEPDRERSYVAAMAIEAAELRRDAAKAADAAERAELAQEAEAAEAEMNAPVSSQILRRRLVANCP